MKRSLRFQVSSAALAIGLLAAPTTVSAETISLTVAAAPPPVVLNVKLMKEFFIPEVDKRLAAAGGEHKIEWTEAYSSSLAKFNEVFEATSEGIADVSINIITFEPSNLPLQQYTWNVPFGPDQPAAVTKIDDTLHAAVPEMNQAYAENNLVNLGAAAGTAWHLWTNFPVKTMEDLNGQKVGSSGSSANWFKDTGAVAVTSSMVNSVADIRNGVYNGYPAPFSLAFPFKIYEVAPIMTRVNFGARMDNGIVVNSDTWESLPESVQKIFQEVANEYMVRYAGGSAAIAEKFEGILAKNPDVTFNDFSESERVRWATSLPNIAKEWAARQDERGLPGTKVLTTYMDAYRATGETPIREWDKN